MYVRMYVCMPVHLSVRMEKLCSLWTDFHEILYFSTFRKSAEKIKVSLISGFESWQRLQLRSSPQRPDRKWGQSASYST
jgi:hypothetical protein